MGVLRPMAIDRWPLEGAQTVDFYSINHALRGQGSLHETCGAFLDYHGYTSRQQFANELSLTFYDLWRAGALGTRAGELAYRGCHFTLDQLSAFQRDGYIWDRGYSFATPDRDEAIYHLNDEARTEKRIPAGADETRPVLLQVTVGRSSIHLPGDGEDDPFRLREAGPFVERLTRGQFILDRNSMLKITSGRSENNVIVLDCEQRI